MTLTLSDDIRRTLQRYAFAAPHRTLVGLSGEHRSKKRGASPEFADFKSYTPGDDYRRIDWNSYARLDALYIRESETTTEHAIHLILDNGPSMDWAGDDSPQTKLAAAKTAIAVLAWIGLWHFDRVSIQPLYGDRPAWGPFQGCSRIVSMLGWLDAVPPAPVESASTAIARLVRSRRRPGRLVLVTDALELEPEHLRASLTDAASRLWQVTILRIDDPLERDPSPLFDDEPVLEFRTGTTARLQVAGDDASLRHYRSERAAWLESLDTLTAIPGVQLVAIDRVRADMLSMVQHLAEAGVIRR